jgi:hypothetical protein
LSAWLNSFRAEVRSLIPWATVGVELDEVDVCAVVESELPPEEISWSEVRKLRAVAANWSEGPTCCGGGPAEPAALGTFCAVESALFAVLAVVLELACIDARSACSSCSAVELLETLDICTSILLWLRALTVRAPASGDTRREQNNSVAAIPVQVSDYYIEKYCYTFVFII